MAEQVAIMIPKLVVALGIPARRFLGRVGGHPVWASSATFEDLDAESGGQAMLQFGARSVVGVALMHPSYREVNLRARPRTHLGVRGPEAETTLLAGAVRLAADPLLTKPPT